MRSAVIEQKCNIFGSMNFFYRVPSIPVYMNKNSITITLCSDNKNGQKKGKKGKPKLKSCIFNFNSDVRIKKRVKYSSSTMNSRMIEFVRSIWSGVAARRNPGGGSDSEYPTRCLPWKRVSRAFTPRQAAVLPCVKFDNLAAARRFESIRRKWGHPKLTRDWILRAGRRGLNREGERVRGKGERDR